MKRKKSSKSQVSSLLNRVIAMSIVLFVLVGAFGLATVYLRHEIAITANDIKQIERSMVVKKRKLAELGVDIAEMTTISSLQEKNDLYAFQLRMPEEGQIVRVSENVEARLFEKTASSSLTALNF